MRLLGPVLAMLACLAFSACLETAAGPTESESPTSRCGGRYPRFMGTVRDPEGSRLPGTYVSIAVSDHPNAEVAGTDAMGDYVMCFNTGTYPYTLRFEKLGYQVHEHRGDGARMTVSERVDAVLWPV